MAKTFWAGDSGTTRLFDETPVRKDAPIVNSYGWIDELASFIGLCRVVARDAKTKELLRTIQEHLFVMGADLATPLSDLGATRLTHEQVVWLEQAIAAVDGTLPELQHFILAGGTESAAQLHIARTVCRRAERAVFAVAREQDINVLIPGYLNRLSSLLFALARYENMKAGVADEEWRGR